LTLRYVLKILKSRNPASIRVCALFDKNARRIVDTELAYRGFDAPDLFLVGYGLDHLGRYRNLPQVYALSNNQLDGL